jgi:hypothetical protein
MPSTRRTALHAIGTALAGAVAGCSGIDDAETPTARDTGTPTDTETAVETPTATPTPEPATTWTDWTPAPAALGIDGAYAVLSLHPNEIASYSDSLPAAATDGLDSNSGLPGLGPLSALERVTVVGNAITVFSGPADPERARSSLADRGLTVSDRIGGLTLHTAENGDPTVAVGVGSDVIIAARTRNSGVDVTGAAAVRAVTDRTAERLPDAVPAVGTVHGAVGDGTAVALRANTTATETVAGATGEGYSWRLGTEETRVTAAFAGGATAEGVETWASDSEMFGDGTLSVTASGGAVTAAGTVSTAEIDEFQPDWKTPKSTGAIPKVSFGFDYDSEAGLVTVTHEGGETLVPDAVALRGSGFADRDGAAQTAAGPWQGTVSDSGIVAGDQVTVGVTPGYELRVVWTGESRTATLAVDRGPDA